LKNAGDRGETRGAAELSTEDFPLRIARSHDGMPDVIGSARDAVTSEPDCLAWHFEFGENAVSHNDAIYPAAEGCPRRGGTFLRPKITHPLGYRTRASQQVISSGYCGGSSKTSSV
jgi:hypothetical protein